MSVRSVRHLLLIALVLPCLSAAGSLAASPDALDDLLPALRQFADNLIAHGRDHYGPKQTPLFVSQLDGKTRTLPPAGSKLYISDGRGGAGPTMNNLQFDSGLLRLLYGLTRITGEGKYARAADEYLGYYLAHLPDAKGNFPWGDHRGYDVVRDEAIAGSDEFKITCPPWEELYRVNPAATTRQIEALKLHIIDESRSYAFNRHHPPGKVPHSMNSSGGAYVAAWAFLHRATGDPKYRDWAGKMADYLWSLRNPKTNLLAAHPADPLFDCKSLGVRPTRTEYMGPWCWYACNLLRAATLPGPEHGREFRDQALAYMRAFIERADITPEGHFHATFRLDTGEPLFPRLTNPWRYVTQYKPGEASSGVTGLRAPISLAFGYKITREPELQRTFDRLLPALRLAEFEDLSAPPKPIPAGLLASAIGALVNMRQATGDARYLDGARTLARYAMTHYWREGFFVCGPPDVPRYRDEKLDVWHLYSNRGGSAELALELLRLHLVLRGQKDFVTENPISYF